MNHVPDVKELARRILDEIGKVVVGKKDVLRLMIVAILSEGHVLLEGVPGVAKTLIAKSFADSLKLSFKRIQFTPDMLPSDVVGTFVFNQKLQDFTFRRGPIFCNIVLADEINRSTPKTQSALLEAMQERQVTVEGVTEMLDEPFMVMATQNPVEHEGTYPLPEAQLDRFMFRILISYPEKEEEGDVLSLTLHPDWPSRVKSISESEELVRARRVIRSSVHVSEELVDYVVSLVSRTRDGDRRILLGASPRASVHLLAAARSIAAMEGRDYVIPDDVKLLAFPALNHRIILRPEYLMEASAYSTPFLGKGISDVLEEIVRSVEPPS